MFQLYTVIRGDYPGQVMGKTRRGLKYVPKDPHFFEAKKQGYVARSALKLEELDKKHRFFKTGQRVLDLGCAPGSWLQYAAKRVGPSGRLVGVDIDPVRVELKNAQTFVADLTALTPTDERLTGEGPYDLFQSDAMTKTTGIPDSDCARSVALVEHGLSLAKAGLLKEGGIFLAKVFEGPGFTEFYVEFKRLFAKCSVNKPEAIRQGSREVYILGVGFRPQRSTSR